jgi:hypothetical protein
MKIRMKKLSFSFVAAMLALAGHSQSFSGLNSGNYAGVNAVFANPANVADSRYRFDINLFSLQMLAANDQASFSLKNISTGFKGDSLRNQVFGKDAGPASGMLQTEFRGPSVMFNMGKNSFAVTTRGRMFANITDFDGKLFDKISEDFNNDPSLPYNISSSQNMRFSVNAWSEIGISYGRVLVNRGSHFIKGGITMKYLAGAGNGFIAIDRFNGTIDQDLLLQDAFLRNTNGTISTGFGGINFSGMDAGRIFDMNSSGIGSDIGVVYEFRPGGTILKSRAYKLKLGAALLDFGKIRYEKDARRSGSYNIDIAGNERLSFRELDNLDIDNYNEFFESRPAYFTPATTDNQGSYSVSLPSTLQLEADYHIIKGLYVNATSQIALASNKKKAFNPHTYSAVTVTPRYEMKRIGVYLPVNYNSLTKMNAGACLRLGPLFVGSASIVSALMGESKQADFYFGFRIGMLR